MKKGEHLILSGIFLCAAALLAASCAPSLVEQSRPLPGIVKEFKHFTLYGNRSGMLDTGIYLEKGALYTVMATGSIDLWPSVYGAPAGFQYHDVRPKDGWALMARFGDQFAFRPLFNGRSGNILNAYQSGSLHLGLRDGPLDIYGNPKHPEYYNKNNGSFSVYVIAWNTGDYARIADFMRQLAAKAPENEGIADALKAANQYRRIYEAKKEATEEIARTKQQIAALKSAPKPEKKRPVPETAPAEKKPAAPAEKKIEAAAPAPVDRDKVSALEAKLAKLAETLRQLENMQKELEKEREKSTQLEEQLQEKEQKEKELLTKIAEKAKSPPVLILASPAGETKTEAAHIRLIGAAEDDKGVGKVEISVNGAVVQSGAERGIAVAKGPAATHVDFSKLVPLEKGKNVLMVRAYDEEGLSAQRTVVVHRLEKKRTLWAVIVGINDYPHVRKLNYAVNDARAFYDLLVDKNGVPKQNVSLLLNGEATLTALRSTLGTALKKKAGKDDMVIIYFAGHGASERDAASEDGDGLAKYLLPFDANLEDLYSTALPMREIAHIIHRIRSDRLVFLVDACYSGASGGRSVSYADLRANISDKFLDRLAAGRGKVIISASGANEVSAEDEKVRHGIFTYYLLEALSGRADADNDKQVSVDEAYRYVSEHVSRATGQEQHPVRRGVVEGNLILSVIQ